jgi:allophanate hydrolase
MLADPVRLNSNLGLYTNFVNLLDMSAIAVPTGFRPDGLPFGVTFCAAAFDDARLLELAARIGERLRLPLGAVRWPYRPTGARASLRTSASAPEPASGASPAGADPEPTMALVACGAHMSGLPLNHQLLALGAQFECRTTTARAYQLHALTAFDPPRPGLARRTDGGSAIEVEVWRLPVSRVGRFLQLIPAPLVLGRVELAGGRVECGFLCEPHALASAPDISDFGGWRAYLAARRGA